MSNEPRDLTLPDSGATVRVKFIGPMLMADIEKSVRRALAKEGKEPPEPPLKPVNYSGNVVMEPSEDDPHYKKQLAAYEQERGIRTLDKLLRYGVEYTLTDADRERLAALRQDAELELPADDAHAYVSRVLLQSENDLVAVQTAILSYAQPTEAQVAESIKSFPGGVQGA